MEDRFVKLLERVFTNEKTRKNYESRLRTLIKHMNATTLEEILIDPEKYYPAIRAHYESLTTRRNVLTAILVMFREDEVLRTKTDIAAKWRKLFEEITRHTEARAKRSEPEDKQIAKYTSFEEIESKYEEMKKFAPHSDRKKSFQFVLLSFIVYMRPKRADLGTIHIFKEKDPNRTDINYLVLRKKGASFLAMNIYKTSKHYQTVEEDLPDGLRRDIIHSLKRWPRAYLFTKENGQPMSNNTYSHFVMNAFQEIFGRATGVSLLRHIYISEKLDLDNMTLEEQDEEAKLMLHTSGLQRRYKWPKKVICPKLCSAYLPDKRRYTLSNGRKEKNIRGTRKNPKDQKQYKEYKEYKEDVEMHSE
jgi:hypothetical protein